ncbi:FimV/HubP family polar landmark protein [Psychrobacter urativorans]|uniref:FimV/HubP family polar landmark protein n=1 Tax=Psychrobacter urativorans TaxID=45610 RepID=UPI00191A4921|nr:FimV/HubP family polar landmark protein [Psychrobacter urativorans]
MDNMLYIVAGLAIVLLLVLLVKRRNSAQQPLMMNKKPESSRSNSTVYRSTVSKNNLDNCSGEATKFDSVTIAQRFIDQQRYDKAIEALQRGLAKKPNDGPLLLKLLDIYVVTNQRDDFYRIYNTIQTDNDQTIIEQAQQLQDLMAGQQPNLEESDALLTMSLVTDDTSAAASHSRSKPLIATSDTASTFEQDDYLLDLHSLPSVTDTQPASIAVDPKQYGQECASFDLLLADLEAADLTATPFTDTPFTDTPFTGNSAKPPIASIVSADAINLTATNSASNIDDDFSLSFDNGSDDMSDDVADPDTSALTAECSEPLIDDQSTQQTLSADSLLADTIRANSAVDQLSFNQSFEKEVNKGLEDRFDGSFDDSNNDNDDFVMDLADLSIEPKIDSTIDSLSANELASAQAHRQDFVFSLEDSAIGIDAAAFVDNATDGFDTDIDIDIDIDTDTDTDTDTDFDIELTAADVANTADSPTNDNLFDFASSDDADADDMAIADLTDSSSSTPASESTVTDVADKSSVEEDWLLTDDFVNRVASSAEPVTISTRAATELSSVEIATDSSEQTPVEFDSPFSADFNFVKSLDSYQVILDLAYQYLQLGENDSAKRLLTEVVDQGSSEQQQQAQALLAQIT